MARKIAFVLLTLTIAACVGTAEARELEGLLTSWEISPNEPYDLAVLSDGSVWIAVDDEVLEFDPNDGTYLSHQALFMIKPVFRMIIPDASDMLWLSDEAGERIVRFNPTTHHFDTWQIPHPQFDTPAPPFGITPGPDGNIWFTTVNTDLAIGRLNPGTGVFTRYEPPGDSNRGMPVQIAFDSNGIAWFTLDTHFGDPGLGRLDPSTGAITSWQNPYPGAMTPFGIVIVEDEIWFADHSLSAIVNFDTTSEHFTVYPAPPDLVDAHFLAVGRNGRLYTAAFASATIGAFNRANGEYETTKLPSSSSMPMGVTTAPNGQIWIAEEGPFSSGYGAVARLTPFGHAALAVGVPGDPSAAGGDAGAANVIFGRSEGLHKTGNQLWHQDIDLMDSTSEAGDNFGTAVASGDFNADGFMDLAVGVGNEGVFDVSGAGAVHIIFGTPISGLTPSGNQLLHQDSLGISGLAEAGDGFGFALATGDFDCDGFSDLAVGVPYEDVGLVEDAGAVNIIHGWSSGLAGGFNYWIHQDSTGVQGVAEELDLFGFSLASGDFDHDGCDDLVVGSLREGIGLAANTGVVHVFPGSPSGLDTDNDQVWTQDRVDVTDDAETNDYFGTSLAVGDFNGDGLDDLAIGAAGEEIDGVTEAGAVNVLYGTSKTGLGTSGQDFLHQNLYKVADFCEPNDNLGRHLAAADFDGDGYDDLAIAATGEDVGTVVDAGAVAVFYGSSTGLAVAGNQFWHQDSSGILSSEAEYRDLFGTLAAADFDFDGYDDLAIGAPLDDIESIEDTGSVTLLYGSAGGLNALREQLWQQDSDGILGDAHDGDLFAYSIAPLHLQRIFIPVYVVIFADGFESGDLSAWSASSP